MSHGARLLLSGILLEQEQEIVEMFSKAGAMLSQRREQEGWVALELLMAESCEGVTLMSENGRPPYPHVCQINVSTAVCRNVRCWRPSSPKLESRGTGSRISNYMADPIARSASIRMELIERLQDEGHSIDAGSSGENLTHLRA